MAPDRSRTRLRSILAGSAGNTVETFDWFVYAAFTLYFAKVFFPVGDPTAQLLSAALLLQDRDQALYHAVGGHVAQRIAAIVNLLDSLEDAE
ncbi:MAG TPA: hypothetical protein PLG07_11130, partial [Phenylobacterium sp.]|nr:hypothetical protein [Phenylobacterium sp.]